MGDKRRIERGISGGSVFFDVDADFSPPGWTEYFPCDFPPEHPVHSIPCVICGDVRYCLILWIPSESERRQLMSVPGQRRNVIFGLCKSCRGRSYFLEGAKGLILAEASAHPETN